MNAIFNIDRFQKLEMRNIFLSRMQYIYITGSLAGLYLISMLMYILVDSSFHDFIYVVASIIIIGGPCFFEKTIAKNTSIFDFTIPVSTFENFFSFWLKYVIIIPGLIVLTILILNLITGIIPVEALNKHAEFMSLSDNILRPTSWLKLFALQSMFMIGYFYFNKYAFVKTSLVLILISIVMMIIAVIIGTFFFSGEEASFNANMGNNQAFHIGYSFGSSKPSAITESPFISACNTIIDIIFPFGMWIVCYFKLKETEI
ncbi:hypothetical protein M2451_000159 [Dysgonomonas sp. PFB1-18]|uniref:hypothetical protein n=1 Tax=unclassified Dysgonomonas TaxID=2630389 RepID=UPI0024758A73|nr:MULTISPECIES: hypothetical protein [unclassified Dysgonomonas]MDH6307710.1 hypothetical protein [Dysgonomonas sp. PF1-14]MDH6337628.1 hypothetical protein [Dysgonomonas sp. PF1-16]MDH6378852.1 hypothetical protein [Dysgonomonas sp. PFB1-18]MDH6396487.1 hypothetical protein [Dysgonomonas sp. PF1-23]